MWLIYMVNIANGYAIITTCTYSSQMVTITTTILAQDHILQDSGEIEQCQPAALETLKRLQPQTHNLGTSRRISRITSDSQVISRIGLLRSHTSGPAATY